MQKTITNMIAVFGLVLFTVAGATEQSTALPSIERDVCRYEISVFPMKLKEYEIYPWELVKRKDFRAAYNKMLGAHRTEKWLQLSGPSGRSRHVVVNQQSLIMAKSCKQHQCDTHDIVILYNPDLNISYGLLREGGEEIWLGNPSDCYQQAIKKLIAW